MSKEMNIEEATEVLKVLNDVFSVKSNLDLNIIIDNKERYKRAIETILADRKRLKEIYNNVSNRNVEITNLYLNSVSKDKIKEKIEKYKQQYETKFKRIDVLQNIIGMSSVEYEELITLRREVFELQDKIEALEELLKEGE